MCGRMEGDLVQEFADILHEACWPVPGSFLFQAWWEEHINKKLFISFDSEIEEALAIWDELSSCLSCPEVMCEDNENQLVSVDGWIMPYVNPSQGQENLAENQLVCSVEESQEEQVQGDFAGAEFIIQTVLSL